MGGKDILGGVIGLGRIPIAGNGSNKVDILGGLKYGGSTGGTAFGLARTGNALKNGDFAALGQAGDHIIGNDLALIAELNGDLAIEVAARFRQRSGINAGAEIDDLDALFIAFNDAGDQVGAIDGRNNDDAVIHIGHGHQGLQLALGVALGGAGLNVDRYAQLFGSGLIAGLHVGPELVGQRDDDRTDLFAVGGRGLAQLLGHRLIKGSIQLIYHRVIHSGGGIGSGGRLGLIAAGGHCQQHHGSQQQCYKFLHFFFLQFGFDFIYKGSTL